MGHRYENPPGAGGGAVDHGTLLGLADNDHTQYALLAGAAFLGATSVATTHWKDWAAVSAASGAIEYWYLNHVHTQAEDASLDAEEDTGMAQTATGIAPGWYWNAAIPTHLVCYKDETTTFFPIPYEPGTILSKIRVKWNALGDADGVKIRLIKRDESAVTTAFTVVGVQQTYTDAGAPYDVTISTYTLPAAETMAANASYQIEIESEVAATGVNLYSVGVESTTRVL